MKFYKVGDFVDKFVLDTGALCPVLVLIAYDKEKNYYLIKSKYIVEEETYNNEMEKNLINKNSEIIKKLRFKYPQLNLNDFLGFFNELIENNYFEKLSLDTKIHVLKKFKDIKLLYHELNKIYEENIDLFKYNDESDNENVGEFRSYLLAIFINANYFITFDYRCGSPILEKFKVRRDISKNNKGAVFPWRVGIIGLCDYLDIMIDNKDELIDYIEFLKNYFEILVKYKKINENHPEVRLIKELYERYGKLLID